ncbi:MAG: phosphoribosylamine--glycine ligase [Gemmatimonadota bacterium]
MKVLLLGGGGREHAIAWKLLRDDDSLELVAAPGNPGIASMGRCVPVDVLDVSQVRALAKLEHPDLVVIGPEAPLARGVSDALRTDGWKVFGPSQAAAELEASKVFAKDLMLRAGIPTALASRHRDPAGAKQAAARLGAPVVIKASGLAAGKGVIVATSLDEAEHAIESMLIAGTFGEAGREVLVEEFMAGEEVSVFAVTNGRHFVVLPTAQDHKRLLDGDSGPNTGGMGACSPAPILDGAAIAEVCDRIIEPTLRAMAAQGAPFSGLLYAGLMLTADGPKVVEFNCRFGDPETQVILPVMDLPLLPMLLGAAGITDLQTAILKQVTTTCAVTTVVAAPGYPSAPELGAPIGLPAVLSERELLFHAGTRLRNGRLESAGGRVMNATGLGGDIDEARAVSVALAERVALAGAHFRRDIGWRAAARRAGAT